MYSYFDLFNRGICTFVVDTPMMYLQLFAKGCKANTGTLHCSFPAFGPLKWGRHFYAVLQEIQESGSKDQTRTNHNLHCPSNTYIIQTKIIW